MLEKSLGVVAAAIMIISGAGIAQTDGNEQYLLHPENVPPEDQRDDVIVVGFHIPMSHSIGTIGSGNRNVPGAQLNAGLLRLNNDYEPVPYLATTWEFSKDGSQFLFTLHPDARFHDGEDITCTDVDFSIKASQENHPFKSMFEPVTGVDGGDTKDCVINLSKPHPALITALSPALLPIIPEHIYNDGQPMANHPRLTNDIVGSGPFRITQYDGQDLIKFERNEDFFIPGLPYAREITIDIVPDVSTLTLGLENGSYDFVSVWDGDDIQKARDNPQLKVVDQGFEAIGSVVWIDINLRDEILSDVRVRKALAYGTDWEQFNEIVYAGAHKRGCSGIYGTNPLSNPDVECYDLDIEKAKELLAEAGYADGLELTMITIPAHLVRAEVLKQQWAKIGVDLQFDTQPDEVTMLKEITAEDPDWQLTALGAWNWGDPVIGVHRTYLCDNRKVGVAFSNMEWYCNPVVDELLAAAGSELDSEKRKALYYEAQDIIAEDVPLIYLTNNVWSTRMQNTVQNPPVGIWGFMDSWAELWIDN